MASVIVALGAELPWRDFQDHAHWRRVSWIPLMSRFRPWDIAQNVLLFIPLGLFIGLEGRSSRTPAALRAVFTALFVSFLGEWSQLYSHTRFPSATDIACNVVGAACGSLIAAAIARPASR